MRISSRLSLPLAMAIICLGPVHAQEIDAYVEASTANRSGYSTGALSADRKTYNSLSETELHRDYLPISADLSKHIPRPGNQGRQGSCVAWAVGYAARSYYTQIIEKRSVEDAANVPSPSYIYNAIRIGDCDTGSYITDALSLLKEGAISLKKMPYSDRRCPAITKELRNSADDFRIMDYRRVDLINPDQIKAQIAAKNPVIFAFRHVPESFDKASGSKVYKWIGVRPESSVGHAMTVVGYDDRKQAFRVINSWGRKWGDRGYLWVDYDTFSRLADEAYVLQPVQRPLPPPPEPPAPTVTFKLPELRCSKLAIDAGARQPVVTGFVGYSSDLERLKALVPAGEAVVDVQLRPWPQCEALLTLENLLTSDDAPSIVLPAGAAPSIYKGGVAFPIKVKTPSLPAYIYVSYFQADGSVVNLEQPEGVVSSPKSAAALLALGDGQNGNPKFVVSPPYGREMVVSIASRAPLFDKPLPRNQTYREYLSSVRRAVLSEENEIRQNRTASASVAFFRTEEP